jgi:hypothetical protein
MVRALARVGALVFLSGCGSAPSTTPSCVSGNGIVCGEDLVEFPFAQLAVTASEACFGATCSTTARPAGATTVNLSQPRSGTLCISGSVKPDGYALLGLVQAVKNQDATKIFQPFDAVAHGISQVTLAIDSPPSQGVSLEAHMVTRLECPGNRLDCFSPPDFKFADITAPGTVTAPLGDFKSVDDPSRALDATVLNDVLLKVRSGSYAFCIHDFLFLDAAGQVVHP